MPYTAPYTATIYLPLSTWINVQAYTNAAFTQRVTIEPETGSPTILTGTGHHNTPMPNGAYGFTTPATSRSSSGYVVTVSVESLHPGSQFVSSQVLQGSSTVMYFTMAIVVSEDHVDKDWNDAVVQFSWWLPPSSPESRDDPSLAKI